MDIDIDIDDPEKREKLRELALSDRETAPVYYELYIEYYDEDPADDEWEPPGDSIAGGDESQSQPRPEAEVGSAPIQHEEMRKQLEAAGYDISPPDVDPCECCGSPLVDEQFYAELEYPPADETDVGYFSGSLCRGCAEELAATVLDELEASDS